MILSMVIMGHIVILNEVKDLGALAPYYYASLDASTTLSMTKNRKKSCATCFTRRLYYWRSLKYSFYTIINVREPVTICNFVIHFVSLGQPKSTVSRSSAGSL